MNGVKTDVDELLQDVACVIEEIDTGRTQNYTSQVREIGEIVYLMPEAWHNISNSLLALDQSLVSLDGLAAGRGIRGFIKRLIRKTVYWYVNPVLAQVHTLHGTTARAMREVANQLEIVNNNVNAMEAQNLVDRLVALEDKRVDERIARLERLVRDPASRTVSAPQAGEDRVAGPVPSRTASNQGGKRGAKPDYVADSDFDYYWFESIHRGDRELVKKLQERYIEYFVGRKNVLDIGCGRGEFLELLQEKDVRAYGVDLDADAIRFCKESGLDAIEADALEHLRSLRRSSLGGAFAAQVAEHMQPAEFIELIKLLFEKVRKGSPIVIETPNPQCLLIFASFFYADLSHVKPIHPETTRFLCQSAGFSDVTIRFINKVPRAQRLATIVSGSEEQGSWLDDMNENIEKLNSVLFSHLDYAAIAWKL